MNTAAGLVRVNRARSVDCTNSWITERDLFWRCVDVAGVKGLISVFTTMVALATANLIPLIYFKMGVSRTCGNTSKGHSSGVPQSAQRVNEKARYRSPRCLRRFCHGNDEAKLQRGSDDQSCGFGSELSSPTSTCTACCDHRCLYAKGYCFARYPRWTGRRDFF